MKCGFGAYKQRRVTAWDERGRKRTYTSLAAFHKLCPSHGWGGGDCTLTNLRCLKDGGGLATVKVAAHPLARNVPPNIHTRYSRKLRVFRLHYASCNILRNDLVGRVHDKTGTLPSKSPAPLRGRR